MLQHIFILMVRTVYKTQSHVYDFMLNKSHCDEAVNLFCMPKPSSQKNDGAWKVDENSSNSD